MKPFWVYMLRCSDGSYYVGQTDDLEKRIAEHQAGSIPGHTSTRRPVELVFATEMTTRDEALQRERQLKRWTRAKKDALVRGDWGELKVLARGQDRRRPSTPGSPTGEPYAQGERKRDRSS
ncbi:MAG TPA: GIY-YIG nuclease family protein [Anaeromyxobacteraceae bacterium]